MLKLFEGGKENVSDCIDDLKLQFEISDEDAEELLPSGRMTYLTNRAHWARTYMSKAGLLTSKRRGHHVISELGRDFLSKSPEKLNNKILREFPSFAEWKDIGSATGPSSSHATISTDDSDQELTPEDVILNAHGILNNALMDELLAEMRQISPARFEVLILDLLSAMGFGGGKLSNKVLTPIAGDGGIDGIINEDSLGLDAVYIQAKRYAPENKVGRPDIQRFVGSLTGESATKGVFVTTSDFSKEAIRYIDRVQQRIVLINGHRLSELMIEHGIGVRVRSTYEIKSLDEDYFSNS